MIAKAIKAQVPFSWVTGDSVYGSDSKMRSWLEERNISYVLGITAQYRIFFEGERLWAAEVIERLPEAAWEQISCGEGSKGERISEWIRVKLRQVNENGVRWLMARRSLKEPEKVAFYAASAPMETTLEELAKVAGTRWAIEECFETAKGELGLDHYEVRSFTGWYRHITLVMLAHAYLTVLRARANEESGEKKKFSKEMLNC